MSDPEISGGSLHVVLRSCTEQSEVWSTLRRDGHFNPSSTWSRTKQRRDFTTYWRETFDRRRHVRGILHWCVWGPHLGWHTQFLKENRMHNYMYARIKFHTYSDVIMEYWATMSRKKRLRTLNDYQRCTTSPGNEGSTPRLEVSSNFSFIATFFSE